MNVFLMTAEIELYRLEQRYGRRKHRSAFHTGAQYVDGEYIYTGSPTSSTGPVPKYSTGGVSRRSASRWR